MDVLEKMMQEQFSLILLTLCLAVVLLLPGCTSGLSALDPVGKPDSTATILSKLPPLPAGREASSVEIYEVYGRSTFDRSDNARENGNELVLTAAADELTWAIWEFNPGVVPVSGVDLRLDVQDGSEAYFALSNYEKGQWDLNGPLVEGREFTLDFNVHSSPGGKVYMAAMVFDSAVATTSKLVFVSSGWNLFLVDSDFSAGVDTSLAEVNGRPAIGYSHALSNYPFYVGATSPFGASWSMPLEFDTPGLYSSDDATLAIVDGKPALTFYNSGIGQLMYVGSYNIEGSSWGTPLALESTSGGKYHSLAEVNGKPAILFRTYQGLKYLQADDLAGSLWGDSIVLTEEATWLVSLAVVNGKPAASYYQSGSADLRYIQADDADGTAWSGIVVVDTIGGLTARWTSLAVVNGRPAISYQDVDGYLKYVRALDADGNTWGIPLTLDNSGETIYNCPLAVVGGVPTIAYYFWPDKDLRFVEASDPDGSAWNAPVVVDSTGDTGRYCSLAEINGKPAISYKNMDDGLKYAIRMVP